MSVKKILVHVCCAPDGAYVLKQLQATFQPVAFFYNPNIFPRPEYQFRLREMQRVSAWLEVPLIEEEPDFNLWEERAAIYKDEPEKGKRCDLCYAIRLEKTAEKAAQLNFPLFTTVMTISPWKKSPVINSIGKELAAKYGLSFLEADFKKKDGFLHSVALSRELGLYRQNYCGCRWSYEESQKRKARKSGPH